MNWNGVEGDERKRNEEPAGSMVDDCCVGACCGVACLCCRARCRIGNRPALRGRHRYERGGGVSQGAGSTVSKFACVGGDDPFLCGMHFENPAALRGR